MTFEKNVLFLGMKENALSDGGKYYTVQLFEQEYGAVQVNVMASNTAVMSALSGLSFGSPLTVAFVLRPKDKLYRLTIGHVC